MSKGVRTILSVATAIAIPFAAPMIAGSAALAGITGSIGMTASSALAGAGLGAARGAVLGEDIGRSALMGGIGGGVSGYMQAPAAAPANVGPAGYVPGGTAGAFGPAPYAPVDAASAFPFATAAVPETASAFGMLAPEAAGAFGSAGYAPGGLSGSFGSPVATPAPVAMPPAGLQMGTSAGAGTGTGAGGSPQTFTEALKAKFTDPSRQADLVLRAAGQLAGSAMAGSGLSSEEQALLNEQTEELRQLQQTNQALFNQRLEQAQNLIGESKYFDPEYFGLQSARRAQIAGAQAKRSGLRGLTGDRREAEGRRYDIETGRRAGTAFDTGFQSAISPRIQTQQAGLAGMPGYLSYQTPATSAQLSAQGVARSRRAEDREGIADLFGPLYK
jgi:hypothetical protein